MLQEAHESIPIPKRWSTMGRFLQPSLSSSSAIQPCLISRPGTSYSPSPGTRLAATQARMTQLALMQSLRAFQCPSVPSTIICSGSTCCLRLLHTYRQMHPPDAAIREAYRSPCKEAALHLLTGKRSGLPASRLLCIPLRGVRLCLKDSSLPRLP